MFFNFCGAERYVLLAFIDFWWGFGGFLAYISPFCSVMSDYTEFKRRKFCACFYDHLL